MTAAIYTLYVLNCGFLILVVLLQAGRGGGAFLGGGGGDQAVFGASGGATFLQKLTVGSAVMFMTLSMVLAYMSSHTESLGQRGNFASDEQEMSGEPGDGMGAVDENEEAADEPATEPADEPATEPADEPATEGSAAP